MFRLVAGAAVVAFLALLAVWLSTAAPRGPHAALVDHVRILDRLEQAVEVESPWQRIFHHVRSLPASRIPDWNRLERAGRLQVTPRLDAGQGHVQIQPGRTTGEPLRLEWRVPVTAGQSCRVTWNLGLPLSHPDWVRVMKAGALRASARPTVRFVSDPDASGKTGPVTLQCWQGPDALAHELPPDIEGQDLLAETSRFIQGIVGLASVQAHVQSLLELALKDGGQILWFDASLDFTAPPGAVFAVLGLEIKGLPGPLPLRWAYGPWIPGERTLDAVTGMYRHAGTHGETVFLKRMVKSTTEHRLSLLMAPRTVVGLDLVFPERGELLFGLKALHPLDDHGAPAPSRLVIEAESDGEKPVLLYEEEIRPEDASGRDRWIERRVSCRAAAGRSGRLRFILDSPAGDRGAGVALSDPILHRPGRAEEIPSVLLLTVDSLRHDYVGKVVNGKSLTPHLDELVARGVRVSHAVAGGLNTYVSMPGMMAAYPITGSEAGQFAQRLRVGIPTLAGVLAASGRFVHAVNPDYYLNNIMKGFHCRYTAPDPGSPGEVDAGRVHEALAFLEQHRDDPFFLWLHLDDPHIPSLPKPEDAPAWEIPGIPDPGVEQPQARFEAAVRGLQSGNPTAKEAAIRYLNAAYTAEVRYADAWVGKVLARLRDLGRDRNTLVVIHADHGMEVGGEHIGWRDFHDCTIRVPLLMHCPGVLEGGIERRGVMSLVDVAPTILDATGVRAPIEWWGRSRLAWLQGQGPPAAEETGIFSQGWAVARHDNRAVIRALDWWYLAELSPGNHGRNLGVNHGGQDTGQDAGVLHDCRGGAEGDEDVRRQHPEVARALDDRLRRTIEATQHGFRTGGVSRSMKQFLQQAGYLPEGGQTK